MEILDVGKIFVLPILTAVLGWLGKSVKSRRENKKSDLELINNAISPLLRSISELTDHVGKVTAELVEEKAKNLELTTQRDAQRGEIEALTSKVTSLERKITALTNLIKKQKHDKIDSASNIIDSNNELDAGVCNK